MKTLWTARAARLEVMRRHKLLNNNQFAAKCGVDPSTGLDWSRGVVPKKAAHIETLAMLLDEEPGYLAHCFAVERESDANLATQMRAWLVQHSTAAMLVFAVFLGISHTSEAAASLSPAQGDDLNAVYYVKWQTALIRALGKYRANYRALFCVLPFVGFPALA